VRSSLVGEMATEVSHPSHSVHFTEKAVEALRGRLVDVCGDGTYYKNVITSQQLVEVARLIPKDELEDLVDNIPPIKDFVELAQREPSTLFLINVSIGDNPTNNYVIVDAVLIPMDKANELLRPLLGEVGKQDREPEEIFPVVEVEREGREMFVEPPVIGDKLADSLRAGSVEVEEDICNELPVTWYDILTWEREVILTCEEYKTLVAKGKAYVMLWWD